MTVSEVGERSILLVGAGNMGGAMLAGWLSNGVSPGRIAVLDPAPNPAVAKLIGDYSLAHFDRPPSEVPGVIVVAVKPQMMDTVLPGLASARGPRTLVVSVAAGRTVASIEERIGKGPTVRAMPNTPAMIGRGMTGCFANAATDQPMRDEAEALLAVCGEVEWFDTEGDIDIVTAVSGSGPAYVFAMTEALAAAGEAAGLDKDRAMRLALATVSGAGELMVRAEDPPATLRRNVTSPGGTTEAALNVLMAEDGLTPLMRRAVAAARDRARELSKD